MTRMQRNANLAAVVIPFLAVFVAVVLLWNRAIGPVDLAIFAFMYLITGFGVTIGFHRLLTHRSFATSKPVEYLFASLGSMSIQGPVIEWVADHRKHHAHTDTEGDPHSPHVGGGHGLRGLAHAHVGWLMRNQGQARPWQYAKDLMEDPGMRRINRAFPLFVLLSLGLPFLLGLVLTGTLGGALVALVFAGFVRIFLLHHVTWSVNSVCHFFGKRRFAVDDQSTNVAWLAIPSLGEAWHHNHHAFPRSARHGLRRSEIDITAFVIRLMMRAGLAWNVIEITPERQLAKEAGAEPRPEVPVAA